MPNWLTKATGGVSRESKEPPQTFQLTCECSERHTGQRKGRPQRIICQTCGAALFVLPKNVYPALKERSSAKKGGRKRRAGGPPTGPSLPSAGQMAQSVRRGFSGAAGRVGRGMGAAAAGTRNWIGTLIASILRSIRRACTPFRLVVTGIVLMLLTTAGVAIRSHAVESARETLRTQMEAGQASLAEEDFVEAHKHFALAAGAVQTIGSDDAQSRLVQQLHRETLAITHLAPGSLFDMLDEAEQARSRAGALTWQDVFGVRYEGTWIVLYAPLRRDASGFVVDFPLRVGTEDREVTVRADLSVFDRLPTVDGVSQALFAAPIADCELKDKQWVVTLDADIGFLWSTLDNLRPLGLLDSEWTDDDEIATLLDSQTRLMGEAP